MKIMMPSSDERHNNINIVGLALSVGGERERGGGCWRRSRSERGVLSSLP